MKNNLFVFSLVLGLMASCLSQNNKNTLTDTNLQTIVELFDVQKTNINGFKVTKLVDTSAGTDRLEFHIDSTFIFNELRVLEGKNFDKVFHSSTYDIKISPLQITYQRKNGENKGPLSLKIEKTYKDSIKSVELVETEENILFTSKKRSLYEFDPMNRIHSYSIDSYQKIIGLDPYEFRIKGKIAPTSDLE